MNMMAHKIYRSCVNSKTTLLALALGVSLLSGCKFDPTNPKNGTKPKGKACEKPEANIADGDDNDNQTVVIGGRGGYWYTFSDMEGTEIWPLQGAKGGTFEMSPGGAAGSPYAARFKGRVVSSPKPTQGGVGMNFVDPKGTYDASAYQGISFWAKVGPGSVKNVRLKVPDANTDPDGGVCSECFNDFGMDLSLSEEWELYIIPFNKLMQLPNWGKPKKFGIDSSRIYGVQLQVQETDRDFDVWIDQLRFTGCGE